MTARIVFIFGTRPEAIKLIPLIKLFREHRRQFSILVCVTSQHTSMLRQVLSLFHIEPDYDLNIMRKNQSLSTLSSRAITKIDRLLQEIRPDLIFVQGDTTTAMAATLVAFYHKIPSAHVEAGLRSGDKFAPFPEEINRVLISHMAEFHFAPTRMAMDNLRREGVAEGRIWVTGNTVIDALLLMREEMKGNETYYRTYFARRNIAVTDKKLILVTGHRRENFGDKFQSICRALRDLAVRDDVEIVYPVHLNPNVKGTVSAMLSDLGNVHLLPPLPYDKLIFLMDSCYCILTDSGGIQEEAPSLGKPVLVMREVTERPEGIEAGSVKLVGTNHVAIVRGTEELLEDRSLYAKMSRATNPYGDGRASERILDVIRRHFA